MPQKHEASHKRLRKAADTSGPGETSSRRPRRSQPPPNWAQFKDRTIHQDRGIELDKFQGMFIAEQVAALQWDRFVSLHPPYCAPLVREFYACMDPEVFRATGVVTVRGCPVPISAAIINTYYGLTPLDPATAWNGMPTHDWNSADRIVPLADALRMQPRGDWVTNHNYYDLSQGQLHMQAAFWNLFCSHSIWPTQNRTNIKLASAFAVYCIIHGFPMDVGRIIVGEMQRPASEKKLSLFFPRLITALCCQAGVIVEDSELETRPAAIGVLHYNTMARERQLETLPRTGYVIPDPEAEEGAHSPHDDPDQPAAADAPPPPPMAEPHPPSPQLLQELLAGQRQLLEQGRRIQSRLDRQDTRQLRMEREITELTGRVDRWLAQHPPNA